MDKQQRFVIFAMLFVILVGAGLISTLIISRFFFPPRQPLTLQPTAPQAMPGFWQRLQRVWDSKPKRMRFNRRSRGNVRQVRYGSGGPQATVTSRAQLAYREALLSTFFQNNFYRKKPELTWKEAQAIRSTGPWRQYELDRLRARILGYRFDEQKDYSVMPAFKTAATAAATSPYANFEDFFWAGHAYLYTGDPKRGREFFTKARDRWPARDSFFGYIHFFMICLDAIDGNAEGVFRKFDDFKELFPDWLYVEIYVTELNELDRLYPDAPLLQVFRAEIFRMVLNDAKALAAFRRALAAKGLDRDTAARVRVRIDQIERRR